MFTPEQKLVWIFAHYEFSDEELLYAGVSREVFQRFVGELETLVSLAGFWMG